MPHRSNNLTGWLFSAQIAMNFNVIQAAKTSANSVYQTILFPTQGPGNEATKESICVCITMILHLCRLTGYNADPESTEGQGIVFEMTAPSEITGIIMFFVLWLVFSTLKNTKEHRGGLGTRLGEWSHIK